jgi:hypothetical protein
MLLIAAGWGFAEAILFFLVADVPISWIAVRWGWRSGALAAVAAALAAAAGGAALYLWAKADPAGAHDAIIALPGIDETLAAKTAGRFAEGGYWAMLTGSLSGVPYKLFVLAAADQGRALLPLILLSPLVRLPRFLAVALLAAGANKAMAPYLVMRARLALLALVWLLFYAFYFALMPG